VLLVQFLKLLLRRAIVLEFVAEAEIGACQLFV